MNINERSLMRSLLLTLTAVAGTVLLGACASDRGNNVQSSNSRVYNPQTGNHEWSTPGRAPTSPGATATSRQPYH